MKQIPLTQEQCTNVDDEDFERLSQHRWLAMWSDFTQSFYAVRTDYSTGTPRQIRMHREITNAKASELVDHQNHNTLDNRRENLRVCNKSQNAANRRSMQRNNNSGYQGVHWDKGSGKWGSRIRVDGKDRSLGRFTSKDQAALAYNEAARHYFGEFAFQNEFATSA